MTQSILIKVRQQNSIVLKQQTQYTIDSIVQYSIDTVYTCSIDSIHMYSCSIDSIVQYSIDTVYTCSIDSIVTCTAVVLTVQYSIDRQCTICLHVHHNTVLHWNLSHQRHTKITTHLSLLLLLRPLKLLDTII